MNGMHGIIFSYEKRNDLRELGEIRSAASIPFGGDAFFHGFQII